MGALGFWVLTPLPLPELPEASRIFDAEGAVIGHVGVRRRVSVDGDAISPYLRQAVVASEDARFYRHFGIDPVGVARAFYRNFRAGRITEGASTITAQLAKEYYLSPSRLWTRKAAEALLTLKIEARMDKSEILTRYLNTVYMGHGAYGAEVAAHVYFGKTAKDLDLAESALLAALLPGPELFTPYRNPEEAVTRRNRVLAKMVDQGMIDATEAAAAGGEPINLVGLPTETNKAAYYIDFVRHELARLLPEAAADLERGGYRIYTAMDSSMQETAQDLIAAVPEIPPAGEREGEERTDGRGADPHQPAQPQGALVAIDPRNGHIKALVGGRDYAETPFNRAYQARRQPGSAFKVFLYTALLDQGVPVTATEVCSPISFPGSTAGQRYEPVDYGSEPYHMEHMTMREAVRISDNVVAVKWMQNIGPATVIRYARRMGIGGETPLEPTLPLALGVSEVSPLELAAAYAPLANLGHRVEPLALLRVEGPDGRVLLENRPRLEQVLNPSAAYLMTDMLKEVLEPGGTGAAAGRIFPGPAAGKTGTTDERRSVWFAGYTPDLVAAVYVGHDDQRPLPGTGGALAAPLWGEFMADALASRPAQDWAPPRDVFTARTCTFAGSIYGPWIQVHNEVFRAGAYPGDNCPGLWSGGHGGAGSGEGAGTGPGGEDRDGGMPGMPGGGDSRGPGGGGTGDSDGGRTAPPLGGRGHGPMEDGPVEDGAVEGGGPEGGRPGITVPDLPPVRPAPPPMPMPPPSLPPLPGPTQLPQD